MIGQSGKMCIQDMYIGVVLSAELQQMVSIVGAKLMVAITMTLTPLFCHYLSQNYWFRGNLDSLDKESKFHRFINV